jgi:hypothetical protein
MRLTEVCFRRWGVELGIGVVWYILKCAGSVPFASSGIVIIGSVDIPAESNFGLGILASPNPNVVFLSSSEPEARPMEIEEQEDNNMDTMIPDLDAQTPWVEEVQDENNCGVEYIEAFPEEAYAGASHGHKQTLFESIHDKQVLYGAEIFSPFESDTEW